MNVAEYINPFVLTIKGKSVFLYLGYMQIGYGLNYFIISPQELCLSQGALWLKMRVLETFLKTRDHRYKIQRRKKLIREKITALYEECHSKVKKNLWMLQTVLYS